MRVLKIFLSTSGEIPRTKKTKVNAAYAWEAYLNDTLLGRELLLMEGSQFPKAEKAGLISAILSALIPIVDKAKIVDQFDPIDKVEVITTCYQISSYIPAGYLPKWHRQNWSSKRTQPGSTTRERIVDMDLWATIKVLLDYIAPLKVEFKYKKASLDDKLARLKSEVDSVVEEKRLSLIEETASD